MKYEFPKGFYWGAATSSHQVEGGNLNDWTEWENKGKTKEKSGKACDNWNLYEKDHDLMQELGLNSYRFSLEWSRIEPEEGVFSKAALKHYKEVLLDLKKRNIKRVVTLNHWTLPLWFSKKYGWHHKKSVEMFFRYCKKVLEELGEEINVFITLNEPTIPLNKGYLAGVFPPGKKNPFSFWRARKNMILAHVECYKIAKKYFPNLPVGITQFCNTFEVRGFWRVLGFLSKRFQSFYNWSFVKKSLESHDFIGIDYYATFLFPFFKRVTTKNRWTDMGWGVYPKGFGDVVNEAWGLFEKPIYIFENGLADHKDNLREDFIKEHLTELYGVIKNGVDVRGYFYWSLLDNFEWNQGFWPRFGLVEIDRSTMERKIRPSAYEYAKICKNNLLEE